MKNVRQHALSLCHGEGGTVVALMLTPDSIGVEGDALTPPLTYRVNADLRTITLSRVSDRGAALRLCDVGDELLDACKKLLPIVVLDNEGTTTIQVIEAHN